MTRRTGKEGLHTRVVGAKKPKVQKGPRCRFCGGPDHGYRGCTVDDKLEHDAEFAARSKADGAAWAKDNPAPPVGTRYDAAVHCTDRLRAWGLGVSYAVPSKPVLVKL